MFKEIYLNLSSRVVLSNRTTYIISPFGLLLQEANQLPATRIDLRRVCSTNNHQSGFLTKRASLQASSAAEIPPESRRNSRNSRHEIQYSLMVYTSQISLGQRQDLSDVKYQYIYSRTSSFNRHTQCRTTEGATPLEEPEGTPSLEGTTTMARLSTDIGLHEAERA